VKTCERIALRKNFLSIKNVKTESVSFQENGCFTTKNTQASSISVYFHRKTEEYVRKSEFKLLHSKGKITRFSYLNVKADHNNNKGHRTENLDTWLKFSKILIQETLKECPQVKNGVWRNHPNVVVVNTRIRLRLETEWRRGHDLEKGKEFREVHNIKKRLLILSGDIETNPGPISESIVNKGNMFICSYNLQGCANFKKKKRFMNLVNKLPFSNNCIINLQETHWCNSTDIGYHWRKGHVLSKGSTNARGVAILYNKAYFDEVIETFGDNEGRMCSVVTAKDNEIYCFVNLYAPNDHYQAQSFFERVDDYVSQTVMKFPDVNMIISGDYNLVFDCKVDSIGRSQTKQERKVVTEITTMNRTYGLNDVYRHTNKYGGFTWGKNNPLYLRSRLDHIFVGSNLLQHLISTCITFEIGESDHGFLFSEFGINEVQFGPGIVRANADLLNDPDIKKRVLSNLKEKMDRTDPSWDPHLKLDHHKYCLRSLLLQEGKKVKKEEKSIIESTKQEVNMLRQELDRLLLASCDNDNEDCAAGI